MKYKYKYSLEANFFNVTKEAKSLYKIILILIQKIII